MQLSVIGSGYVGTTVAACFADCGHDVVNVDLADDIVDDINDGTAPIHEDGLQELIDEHAGPGSTGRLRATTDYDAVLDTELTMLCLPTPQNEDGSIDLSVMEGGARTLGETLREKSGRHVVVVKSTVVPKSTVDVIGPTIAEAAGKELGEQLGIGMNPEFLREGTAVDDFQHPDKLVFGTESAWALDRLE